MRAIRAFAFALILAGSSACNPGQDVAVAWEALADRACSCPNNACAEATLIQMRLMRADQGSAHLAAVPRDLVQAAAAKATVCLLQRGVKPEGIQ